MQRAIRSLAVLGLALMSTGCTKGINATCVVTGNPQGTEVKFQVYDVNNDAFPVAESFTATTSEIDKAMDDWTTPCRVCVFINEEFLATADFDNVSMTQYQFEYDLGKNTVTVTELSSLWQGINSQKAASQVRGTAKQTPAEAAQIIVQYIEDHVHSEADVSDLFGQLDLDGDGSLSLAEVKKANKAQHLGIKGKTVKQAVAALDDHYGDGDGSLQLEELIAAYIDMVVDQ